MSILPQGPLRLFRKGVEACLPNSCLLCGGDAGDILCGGCTDDLPRLPLHRCPQCAEPTFRGVRCGHCLSTPPAFDATTVLYRYDFPLDRLVHALKYNGQLSLAGWFGRLIADELAGSGFDRIIPMPLHPSRVLERGFNQAGEIARAVGRQISAFVDVRSCRRWRSNQPQALLPLAERAANVRGIFECIADLSGQRILLVDDVMTSGATMNECARVLKLHGAASVEAAVIARALRN